MNGEQDCYSLAVPQPKHQYFFYVCQKKHVYADSIGLALSPKIGKKKKKRKCLNWKTHQPLATKWFFDM